MDGQRSTQLLRRSCGRKWREPCPGSSCCCSMGTSDDAADTSVWPQPPTARPRTRRRRRKDIRRKEERGEKEEEHMESRLTRQRYKQSHIDTICQLRGISRHPSYPCLFAWKIPGISKVERIFASLFNSQIFFNLIIDLIVDFKGVHFITIGMIMLGGEISEKESNLLYEWVGGAELGSW